METQDRPMRRREREIADRAGVEEVLRNATTLFLGLHDGDAPYVVPVSFGWEDGAIWVHSAAVGAKIDLLRKDPRVGFAAEWDTRIVKGEAACNWSVRSRSVTGTGSAKVVEDETERRRGMDAVMRHYGDPAPEYGSEVLSRTLILRIDVKKMRGKRIGADA